MALAAADKQAAEEAEAREQQRMKALRETTEREEAEEQERLIKEKEKKDQEEYNAQGDLGEMMNNLKTQVQKEASMGKEYKKEEPAPVPKTNNVVQVEDSDKDINLEYKPDDSEQNVQLKASMGTDSDTKSAVKIEVKA